MQEVWRVYNKSYRKIAEELKIPPVLAKIIANRTEPGEEKAFLDREGPLRDPFLIKDMDKAVEEILRHIRLGHPILVIGDYDVDGMTSATILGKALHKAGAIAEIRIPDRTEDGYGIRPYMVEEAAALGFGLIITCDNGIREFEAADKAAELGLPIVITDHHEIEETSEGERFPAAAAVINPHRREDTSGFRDLCGAGVAYQTARALMQATAQQEDPDWIGYAALGTVCDIMKLTGDNRKIVYQGLKRWNAAPPAAIRAMMQQGAIEKLDVYTFGFVLGPMINSGGRLDAQQNYIHVLQSEDPEKAEDAARKLYQLNRTRQAMTDEGFAQALEVWQRHQDQMVQIIYLPDLHESLAGLVAGKIKEKSCRPTFVLTGRGGNVKGSGRSIPAYSMFEEMQKAADCFIRYGGHPMAAGLSMEEDRIEELRARLNQNCTLTEEDCRPLVMIDMAMPLSYANEQLAEMIGSLEPFGTGNPRPLFADKGLELRKIYWIGQRKRALRLMLEQDGIAREAILFKPEMLQECVLQQAGAGAWEKLDTGGLLQKPVNLDIAYHVGWNEFRGRRRLQIEVSHLRPAT
ncbi:MAG: single-stranded-DNA-specific exonuclease RecJ [Firmicutes bacterium]|nr:single-stranded-DNA-specific exonuclease RecJ [Bacillota bacterium]